MGRLSRAGKGVVRRRLVSIRIIIACGDRAVARVGAFGAIAWRVRAAAHAQRMVRWLRCPRLVQAASAAQSRASQRGPRSHLHAAEDAAARGSSIRVGVVRRVDALPIAIGSRDQSLSRAPQRLLPGRSKLVGAASRCRRRGPLRCFCELAEGACRSEGFALPTRLLVTGRCRERWYRCSRTFRPPRGPPRSARRAPERVLRHATAARSLAKHTCHTSPSAYTRGRRRSY